MSYSKIHICNMALALLGEDSIRSFDESNKRARLVDIMFNSTRDYLLARFDWPFARSFEQLQQLADVTTPPGIYAYQLPAACVTPRSLYPKGSRIWWDVTGRQLWCKLTTNVYLYYTRQCTNSAEFSDTFVTLTAILLAVRIGPAISADKDLVRTLYGQYQQELRDCWESDANIGNTYREADERPENDTFVNPDVSEQILIEPRYLPNEQAS